MSDTPKYYAVLTEAGAALEARALAEGRGVVLTHIAIGDANLEEVTPDPAVTELIHEVHRRPIDAKSLDEDDPKITLLHTVIPASEGGFWIRELGVIGRLEDAEGDECNPGVLYAYANHAPYYKMLPQDGQTVTHELTVPIAQASNARLIIQVSDEGYATRRQFQDLNERVGALEGELSGGTDGENSGIVARVDALEEVFTPPANSNPGKKGLVPAPGAMDAGTVSASYLGADAQWHAMPVKIITEPLTLYVNAGSGEDTLDEGRGWSADKPFKTIKATIAYATEKLDIRAALAIEIAAGTYIEPWIAMTEIVPGGETITLNGHSAEDTILEHSGEGYGISVNNARVNIQNLHIKCSKGAAVLSSNANVIVRNCKFTITESHCIHVASLGRCDLTNSSISINATSGQYYVFFSQGWSSALYGTINVSGACNCFIESSGLSYISAHTATFTGTLKGVRYRVSYGGKIYTGGKGANFFPGDTAGWVEASSGSVYY